MSQGSKLFFMLLFSTVLAEAKQFRFPKVDFKNYGCKNDKEFGTDNIPPARSQSFSNCFSYAATCLADYQNCKANKTDCTKLGMDKRFSVFDLTRLGVKPPPNESEDDRDSYKRIFLDSGGSTYTSLRNLVINFRRGARESCAPADVFVSKKSSIAEQEAFQDEMWKKLEVVYKNHRKKISTCPDDQCAAYNATVTAKDYLEKNPSAVIKQEELLAALAEKSYAEFLSRLLIPDTCLRANKTLILSDQSVGVAAWPTMDEKVSISPYAKLDEIINKKEQIAAIEGICMEDPAPPRKQCKSLHTLVVHKYCEMCNKNSPSDCFPAIKIQNSWGQSWQDEYQGGWVPANAVFDRTGYKDNINTLTWLDNGAAL